MLQITVTGGSNVAPNRYTRCLHGKGSIFFEVVHKNQLLARWKGNNSLTLSVLGSWLDGQAQHLS